MQEHMHIIQQYIPAKLVFGDGCRKTFLNDVLQAGHKKILMISDPNIPDISRSIAEEFAVGKLNVFLDETIATEPTLRLFNTVLKKAEEENFDMVIGLGGGSVLDVAKLVAVFHKAEQKVENSYGIGHVEKRGIKVCCLPTTAGTGSEVSPNAILLDERTNTKVGIISPHLVPDAAYVDPELTFSVPPSVTASTGLDALTHCIEAYANKFAHPLSNIYALEGIKRIASSLLTAYQNPKDPIARRNLAMGSLLGGICLGTANTAAVHALSYPLGSRYKVAHGIANAVLLATVLEANLDSASERYAEIALSMGIGPKASVTETAKEGIAFIKKLCNELHIPDSLIELGVTKKDIPELTRLAMQVQRLLKNNVKEFDSEIISKIYSSLL
jgi:alcohol dehydrogenase